MPRTIDGDSSSGAATSINGGTSGALVYQTAPNTTGFLSIGANGTYLKSNGTVPGWTAPTSPTIRILTRGTTGTYSTPAGCTYIIVDAVAGGGSGGGYATGSGLPGAGGGGGAYAKFILGPGNYGYIVGQSSAAVSNNSTGNDGNYTLFHTATLNGGKGGGTGTPPVAGNGGTIGAVGSAKYTAFGGAGGQIFYNPYTMYSGSGGNTVMAQGPPGNTGIPINNVDSFGIGGCGAGASGFASGTGAGGIIIITEYYN